MVLMIEVVIPMRRDGVGAGTVEEAARTAAVANGAGCWGESGVEAAWSMRRRAAPSVPKFAAMAFSASFLACREFLCAFGDPCGVEDGA